MPKYRVNLLASKDVEIQYSTWVEVEAADKDEAGDKAAESKTKKTWEMDDPQPEDIRTTSYMRGSICVNEVEEVR